MSESRRTGTPPAGITLLGFTLSACALVVAACSDSTEPENPLTPKEATTMFAGLAEAGFEPIFASPDSVVRQCPLGGRIKLVGSIDERPPVNDTARAMWDFEITPTRCGFTASGFEFTIDADPGIRDVTTMLIAGTPLTVQLDGSTSGTLDWELADKNGTCPLSLRLSGAPGLPGVISTTRYAGTMCGHEVDFEASWILGHLLGR